jgi:DNA polymerase I
MTTIKPFPEFEKAIGELPERQSWALPILPDSCHLSEQVQIIETVEQGQALLARLGRLRVGAIAIDTEFNFTSQHVDLGRGRTWLDPKTINSLLLSGAAWLPDTDRLVSFVFDLRRPALVPILADLLRLHTVFVAHFFNAEFKTLWRLGLEPVFSQVYDTWVAAKALTLGRGHQSVALLAEARASEDIQAEEDARRTLAGHLSLVGQCAIYGVEHPYAAAKETLQRSFLRHPADVPFSQMQLEYAAADATATLRLYLAQQRDVIAAGLYPHLRQVEFPYAEANARMEWDGVPVSRERLEMLRQGLSRAVGLHRNKLNEAGLSNPNSSRQTIAFLQRRGHGVRLMRNGKPTSQDEVLAQIEPLDPVVTHLRRFRRYARLLADRLFDGVLIGVDGRLHPEHRHLAAETGRNSCSAPNIVGISKTFRPIVTAPPGRALIELDYAQIEVGICAAEHEDEALIEAFNSGDVYRAVAQQFYAEQLTDEERRIAPEEFKKRCPDLRNKVKVFVLAVLYNMQAQAVADKFRIPLAEAERQRRSFLNCYPSVRAAIATAATDGKVRGYAPIAGGLRRHIPPGSKATNQFINTPVQASAGVVFREAVVRLYHHFLGTSTKLLLPVHDAVVIECDAAKVREVAGAARQVMVDAVRRYYPKLKPRVDINDHDPSCWNKDGQSGSLDWFLADPLYKLA